MRAASRSFVSKNSRAKKAIAIIASAALVASMSNFQAFAAPVDGSENGAQEKVTVCFELDPGIAVDFKGMTISADTEDKTVQVNTGRDYTFKVRASSVSDKAYIIKDVQYMFASPKTETKPVAEKVQEKENLQERGDTKAQASQPIKEDSNATPNGAPQGSASGMGVDGAGESQEVAVPLNDEDEEAASIEDSSETQEQMDNSASAETIPADETPMASPESQEKRELSEPQKIVYNGNGSYTLSKDSINEAAETDRDIVIKLTSEEIGNEVIVNNGQALTDALKSEDNVKVVLDSGVENKTIEVKDSIAIKGNKVLELNGVNLVVSLDGDTNFLTVTEKARLEITDEASKTIESVGVDHKATTTSSENHADGNVTKLGSYDADAKVLTYSVSKSKPNNSTGTTEEYRDTYEMDLSPAGSITSSGINALVKVEDGGNFVMEGGRLTNVNGKHGVEAQGTSSVTISGGFIVGNGTAADGAGIYVKGESNAPADLRIEGDAVIGGNVAAEPHNGGGLYLEYCKATIGGHAIVAANKASGGDPAKTPGDKTTDPKAYNEALNKRNLIQESNGGGIYVASHVALTLENEAAIVSNRAARDGGGIYVNASKSEALKAPSNSLKIEGAGEGVNLSNNEASHDMTELNPDFIQDSERNKQGQTRDWRMTPMGGGAIFSMGNLEINGAQLVNNKSGDSGGGIMLPQVGGYDAAYLKIDDAVVAGNYAHSSEGGGIWCQPKSATQYEDNAGSDAATKSDFSYIKSGYITNNASGTVFDYGGGGLYVNKDGYLCLYSPLVTANTAHGWGGGVAGCHNGFVLSNKIAMFDNIAEQADYTSNANEYADRWAWDKKYLGNLDENASADFFTGRESTVHDEMLGGGSHNWTGYTTGRAGANATFTKSKKWGQPGDLVVKDASGAIQLSCKIFNTNLEDKEEQPTAFAYIPNEVNIEKIQALLQGAQAKFVNTKISGSRVITAIKKVDDPDKISGYYKIHLTIDSDASKPFGDGGQILGKDNTVNEDALVYHGFFQSDLSEASIKTGQKVLLYNVYKIEMKSGDNPDVPAESWFPKGGKVHSNRLLALKANPTKEAKEKAFENACVFISGNYSQTNGGGIANNGYIDLGSPKGDEGNKPKPTAFDLTLDKEWDGFDQTSIERNGTFTAIFRIRAYESKGAYDVDKDRNCKFETIRALTFAKGESESQTLTISDIPKGSYIVVDEMDITGDNFKSAVANGALDCNGGLTMTANKTVKFENTFNDDKSYGTGVVNSYAQGTGGDAHTDDGIMVSQDTVYKKRPHPAAAEAEGGLTNPTDPVTARVAGE